MNESINVMKIMKVMDTNDQRMARDRILSVQKAPR